MDSKHKLPMQQSGDRGAGLSNRHRQCSLLFPFSQSHHEQGLPFVELRRSCYHLTQLRQFVQVGRYTPKTCSASLLQTKMTNPCGSTMGSAVYPGTALIASPQRRSRRQLRQALDHNSPELNARLCVCALFLFLLGGVRMFTLKENQ